MPWCVLLAQATDCALGLNSAALARAVYIGAWQDMPILLTSFLGFIAASIASVTRPSLAFRAYCVGSIACTASLLCAAYGSIPLGSVITGLLDKRQEFIVQAILQAKASIRMLLLLRFFAAPDIPDSNYTCAVAS